MSPIKSMPLWKWILLLVAGFLLTTILYALGSFSTAISEVVPFSGWLLWVTNILSAAAMLGLYALGVRWFEKQWPQDLPLRKCFSHTGLGLFTGFGFFAVVVGVMVLAGVYRMVDWSGEWQALITAFMMFLVVGVGEEIIFRGVLFRWIDERFGFWWAIGISALVFGLIHITNDNATLWSSLAIALEAGVLLGAAYKWAGSLWLPIGIHWAWNFSQGNIFGFAVSGMEAGPSLIQASIEGPAWLTGGAFGAEASVVAVIAGVVLSLFFLKERFNYLRKTPR
jgi:hypothetical protein